MRKIITLSFIAMFSTFCMAQQPESEPVLKYRMDSMVVKLYDQFTGEYLNNYMRKFTYNENQQVVTDIYSYWILSWNDRYKDEYYYNAAMQLDSTVHFDTPPDWNPDYKTVFNYYPDGKLQSEIFYNPENNNWMQEGKFEFKYRADTTIGVYYFYDEGIWEPQSKTIYEYTDGLLSVVTWLITDNNGGFLNSNKAFYEYQNGNLISILGIGTDYNFQWLPYSNSKTDYIYDNSNNLERYAAYYRMDETSEWVLDFERINSYDNQFFREDLIIPSTLDELNYRHMLLDSYENTYYNDETKVMYVPKYNPVLIEKVKSIIEMSANVYPNPTQDYITISWDAPAKAAELSVYDITGLLVKRFRINNNSTIPVADLCNGLHLYTLTSEGDVIGSGKFVVDGKLLD